jgi:hypothetical protein
MFIRFVTSHVDEDSARRQGLFQALEALEKSGRLTEPDRATLDTISRWFSKHLKKPTRLSVSPRPHRRAQAISWYKDTAGEHIAQMRAMQKILERYGLAIEMIKSDRIGYVLYEDEYQVAAYPFADTKA